MRIIRYLRRYIARWRESGHRPEHAHVWWTAQFKEINYWLER